MPLIYRPTGGEDIADAFRRAIYMARDNAQAVKFTFNGEEITVFPHNIPAERVNEWHENIALKRQLYEASPEYLAAKAARVAEGKRLADVAEKTVAAAAVNLTVLSVAVDLCATLAECDHVDADIPWRAYAQMFRAAGYVAGEGVGRTDLDRAPVACGRYIVGQAVDCMLRGMPPHPMTSTFADRWRTMPKTQE